MDMTSIKSLALAVTAAVTLLILPACKQTDGGNLSTEDNQQSYIEPDAPQTDTTPTFEPIQINAAPVNQHAYPGEEVLLEVSATSSAQLSYQWFHDGAEIDGAISPALIINVIGSETAGVYRVVVSNSSTSESAQAVLEVSALPTITQEPQDTAVYPGETVVLTARATGSDVEYQWEQLSADGTWTEIEEATSSQLVIESTSTSDATDYRVKVKNNGGNKTSSNAKVTLKEPLSIQAQPASQNVTAGSNVTFSVAASGHGRLRYQWYKNGGALSNGTTISGASNADLQLSNVKASDSNLYHVVVSNNDGQSVTSNAAQLSVTGPVSITVNPQDTTLYSGQAGSIQVAASGDNPLRYQWQRLSGSNWQNISGATASSLNFTNTGSTDAGRYRCIVSNDSSTDTSTAATITVVQSVNLLSSPQSQTANEGDAVSFQIDANGDNLQYEWSKDGQTISSSNSSTLSFASVRAIDQGTYSCRAFNAGSSVNCSSFKLTIQAPVTITQQPESQSSYEGGSVTFTVLATGTPEPEISWYFNGEIIGSGNSLPLNYLTPEQAGEYSCVVSNGISEETCSATLTVLSSVAILSQPQNSTVNEGSNLSLTVEAAGSEVQYEWFKGGDVIASGPTLTLNNISADQEGTYSCRAWNSNSSDNCNSFAISILTGPSITMQPQNSSGFEGETLTLQASAEGNPAPSFDWYFNDTLITTNSGTLTVGPLALQQAGVYQCVARNSVASESCNSVTVGVRESVRITQQPSGQILDSGEDIRLDIQATGEAPLTYQCFHDDQLIITSGNPADLIIPNASPTDSGNYYCNVSNEGSSSSSNIATITILEPNVVGLAALSWSRPEYRANGEQLSTNEISEYVVYHSTAVNGSYSEATRTSETSAEISNLNLGEHFFRLTTVDINGLESAMSSPITIVIE